MGRRLILIAFLAVLPAAAQQPRVANANVTTRSAAAGLEKEFRAIVAAQSGAAWIGYSVAQVDGDRQMCCWGGDNYFSGRSSNCCGRCRLDRSEGTNITTRDEGSAAGRVNLEHGNAVVLYRVENRNVGKIRVFSEDCELDAGGLPFFWLTDVAAPQSVALLSSFVGAGDWNRDDDRSTSKNAVTAIALHRHLDADRAMEKFVASNQPESLRKHATFWLGEARGRFGYTVLERMLRDDPSDKVREQAIFGLHVSKQPEAVDAMIRAAKNDRSTKVRGQALFWLAQRAGAKASAAITEAIENDPETDVKKKAVFALSQLPKDEGVPKLIQVAKTNRNPAVRKQAIFWLGQSNDPRALAFFEEVLR